MSHNKFHSIVPRLTELLNKHHELYSGKCKGEAWEELCAKALITAGFGSDWRPDFNHAVGKDQITDCGIRISNKSGQLTGNKKFLEISGSRLTSYPTLQEKLEFLSDKHEDYIFCLATDDKEWKLGIPRYYFIVVDSFKLDYKSASWEDMIGTKHSNKGNIVGHRCVGQGFKATIQKSMSHQIWTKIDESLYEEKHEIVI